MIKAVVTGKASIRTLSTVNDLMNDDQEIKLYTSIGKLEANQENVCERIDNLADLLVDKAEKWDKASVVSESNRDHLSKRSPAWDIAATRASVMNKIAVGVSICVIGGGVAFLFFK